MTDCPPVIRHLPFFEALTSIEDASAEWRATTAGLVVLRLVDAWFEQGAHVASDDAWGLGAARDAVAEMDAGAPARAILASVVTAMQSMPRPDFSVVAPRLAAYATSLHFDAKWMLASDVYQTLLEYAHPIDDADVHVSASMQLGYCSRMMGDWDQAATAYTEAGRVAMAMGDVVGILRAQIADARLSMSRGNLPRAEEILDRTIDRALAESLNDVTGLALHERAALAHERKQYEQSIRFGYDALGYLTAQTARDRVLGDIAVSFMELGVTSVARDAFLVLAATAQEQYTRWVSGLNLLDLSVIEHCEMAFESYRRDFVGVVLPTDLQVFYQIHVGKGYMAFGRPDRARTELAQAIEMASRHRLNQLMFDAEQSLAELERGERAAARKSVSAPAVLADVAAAIGSMRKLAGVTG